MPKSTSTTMSTQIVPAEASTAFEQVEGVHLLDIKKDDPNHDLYLQAKGKLYRVPRTHKAVVCIGRGPAIAEDIALISDFRENHAYRYDEKGNVMKTDNKKPKNIPVPYEKLTANCFALLKDPEGKHQLYFRFVLKENTPSGASLLMEHDNYGLYKVKSYVVAKIAKHQKTYPHLFYYEVEDELKEKLTAFFDLCDDEKFDDEHYGAHMAVSDPDNSSETFFNEAYTDEEKKAGKCGPRGQFISAVPIRLCKTLGKHDRIEYADDDLVDAVPFFSLHNVGGMKIIEVDNFGPDFKTTLTGRVAMFVRPIDDSKIVEHDHKKQKITYADQCFLKQYTSAYISGGKQQNLVVTAPRNSKICIPDSECLSNTKKVLIDPMDTETFDSTLHNSPSLTTALVSTSR
jgi:hypothetical protein